MNRENSQLSSNPLISVITVVYNGTSTLEKTMLSVINQTYKNIEYIIIDGDSIDGTIDIIKKYEDKLAYWVSEPDKGIYNAMNKGIGKATGDWVNFMNAGDIFCENDIIENIFTKEYKEDIVYGDTKVQYKDRIKLKKAHSTNKRNIAMPFGHQSVFVKTSLLKENPFNEVYKICADKDLFFKLYNKSTAYCYLNAPVSVCQAFGYSTKNRFMNLKEANKIYVNYKTRTSVCAFFFILKAYVETLILKILRNG
jgi:glycosyltransferase involved in cell wall biosynthesis